MILELDDHIMFHSYVKQRTPFFEGVERERNYATSPWLSCYHNKTSIHQWLWRRSSLINLNLASSWWKSPRGFDSGIKTLGVRSPCCRDCKGGKRVSASIISQELVIHSRAHRTRYPGAYTKRRGTRRRAVILFGDCSCSGAHACCLNETERVERF